MRLKKFVLTDFNRSFINYLYLREIVYEIGKDSRISVWFENDQDFVNHIQNYTNLHFGSKVNVNNQLFGQRWNELTSAGFEFHDIIIDSQDQPEGAVFVNLAPSSPYYGQCVDLYQDGTFVPYCQKKGRKPTFKFGSV